MFLFLFFRLSPQEIEESLDPEIFEVVGTGMSENDNTVSLDGSGWEKSSYTESIVLVDGGKRTTPLKKKEKEATDDKTGAALIAYQELVHGFLDNIIADHQRQPFLVKLPCGESLTPAQVCKLISSSEKSVSGLEKELSEQTKLNETRASRISEQDLEIKFLKDQVMLQSDQVLKFKALSDILRSGSARDGAKLLALKEEIRALEEENQCLKNQCFSDS